MGQASKFTSLMNQYTDAAARPLGILLDEHYNIECVQGNSAFYGYGELRTGTPISKVLPFTKGLAGPIDLTLPFARTPNGQHANVQIAFSGGNRHILLTAVAETRVLELKPSAHANSAVPVSNHEQWLLHGLQTELDWFREIFDKAAVGMSIVGPGQVLLRANRALCDMLGYAESEIVGDTYAKFTHPDDLAANVDLTQRFYEHETRRYELEKRYLRKDGRVIWAQVTASPVRYPGRDSEVIFAVVQDITARKQVEQALSREEHRLRAMMEAVPGCVTINRPDGTIEEVNPGGLSLLEAEDAGQILGRRVQDFVKAPGRAGFIDYARGVLEDKGGSHEFEAVTLKGRSVWLETRGVKLRGDDGRVLGLLAATHDITERKRAQQALVDSLHEKEALLQEVHHRVKNNLQVVSSLLNLQSGHVNDEATRQMIRASQARLQAMMLIHETLYRSRDISRIDFAEYAGNLVQHLAHANDLPGRRIALVSRFAPAQMNVDTAISCGLILNELVSNCLKHAFPEQQPGRIRVTLASKGRTALALSVADNGVGLPANFEPHGRRTLGMRIVNALVSQLSGTLELKNGRRGAIARLTFEVPATA
jgi:PAS domain S-box-containing protein